MLDSQLIAPDSSGQFMGDAKGLFQNVLILLEKKQFSNLGSVIQLQTTNSTKLFRSIYIPLHLPHVLPQCVGTLPPSKAHTSPEPCVQSDHYCVGALYIIAHTPLKLSLLHDNLFYLNILIDKNHYKFFIDLQCFDIKMIYKIK